MANKTIRDLFDKITSKHFENFVETCRDNWKGKKGERLDVTLGIQFEHKDKAGKVLDSKVGKLQFRVE